MDELHVAGEARALAALDRRLVAAASVDQALETATGLLVEALAVDRAFYRDARGDFSWVAAMSCAPGVPLLPTGLGSPRPPLDMRRMAALGSVAIEDIAPLAGDPLVVEPKILRDLLGIRAFALRLVAGRAIRGVLGLHSLRPRAWSAWDLFLLQHVAGLLATVCDREVAMEALRLDSRTDELTGLLNRRAFSADLDREVERSLRHERPLSLVLADLNELKRVNDTKGHQAGDVVVRRFAAWFRREVRRPDRVYRFGGDEFAAILPDTDRPGARRLCCRLLSRAQPGRVHPFSAGYAALPEDTRTVEGLISVADGRLYDAKRHKTSVLAVIDADRTRAPSGDVLSGRRRKRGEAWNDSTW